MVGDVDRPGRKTMFDLRKFWLRTAMFVSIMGAVIVAVGAAFHAFIGITTQGHPQVVPQAAKIQAPDATAVPVAINRDVAAPKPLPRPSLVQRTQATAAMTPEPQMTMPPVPQIIVPEPRASRRLR
jgi:hypothetical protein